MCMQFGACVFFFYHNIVGRIASVGDGESVCSGDFIITFVCMLVSGYLIAV